MPNLTIGSSVTGNLGTTHSSPLKYKNQFSRPRITTIDARSDEGIPFLIWRRELITKACAEQENALAQHTSLFYSRAGTMADQRFGSARSSHKSNRPATGSSSGVAQFAKASQQLRVNLVAIWMLTIPALSGTSP